MSESLPSGDNRSREEIIQDWADSMAAELAANPIEGDTVPIEEVAKELGIDLQEDA
jgi:hypothetical protein